MTRSTMLCPWLTLPPPAPPAPGGSPLRPRATVAPLAPIGPDVNARAAEVQLDLVEETHIIVARLEPVDAVTMVVAGEAEHHAVPYPALPRQAPPELATPA